MRAPAAFAAAPTLAGAVLGLCLWDRLPEHFALAAAAAAALAVIVAAAALGAESSLDAALAALIGFFLAGASLGAVSAAATYRPPLLEWFDLRRVPEQAAPTVLEGVLIEDAALTSLGPSLFLAVTKVSGIGSQEGSMTSWKALGGVRLSVSGGITSAMGSWRAGRRLRVTATLRRPSMYLNPGVRDERAALARRGIVLVGSIKSGALVEVLEEGAVLTEVAASVRAWTRRRLQAAVAHWSPRSAGIAAAILIGDRTGLKEEDIRRLQEAGTYHVIAISGGNIAILTTVLLLMFHAVRVPSQAAAALTILVLAFYSTIAVPAPSVDRAICASIVYLVGRVLDQRGPALNVLAVAALLGVAIAPVTAFDPGFLLSFGATLGILIALRRAAYQPPRTIAHRILQAAGVLFVTTVAAEMAIAPIGAWMFSRLTAAGLVLNFIAIPLMSIVQTASLAVLLATPFERLALGSGFVTHRAADGLIESARLAELAPWLIRTVMPPAWWLLAVYYTAVVLSVKAGARRLVRASAIAASVAGGLIVLSPGWTTGDDASFRPWPMRIVFLDVGQGDSTAVLLPGGHAVVVDAGGLAGIQPVDASSDSGPAFDIGARVIAPALRALGVWRLDALVVTHGDPDHLGGARALVRGFRPTSVWEGVPVPPHPNLRALRDDVRTMGGVWRTVQAGDVERFGDVTLRVLHPPLPEWERQRVRNEDSIVLEVRYGDVSVILPGDIGKEGEHAVLPLLAPTKITVLKAPHHGSATSSTPPFLDRLNPDAVIFSTGRANRFGHPHPAVAARYRERGTSMFNTAEDGAVILDTDGQRVRLSGWTGRVLEMGEN